MTRDDIKRTCSMVSVIGRYGFHPNRAGFISCPFHTGDRTASMKIYEKDFHCFACGAHGDIFEFIMRMENCSFKKAFAILGGTYEKPTFSSKLAVYQSQKKIKMKQKKEDREIQEKVLNVEKIHILQRTLQHAEPLSNIWCDCYNLLQKELYKHAELNGLESRW